MDLLFGEYGKKMYIYYGDGNGSVSGGGPITDAEGSQEFGNDRFNGPALIDMNGDGLKDMLVANCNNGTYEGGNDDPGPLKYYKNVGKVGEPLFQFIENIRDTTGAEIRHVYMRVRVADMDNDGLDDIITGNSDDKDDPSDSSSFVMIYRNCGTKNEYRFEPGVRLDLNTGTHPPIKHAIRLGVSDINNDGVQDLIINTSHHYSGKAGVFLGVLKEVSNGKKGYSLQADPMHFSLSGTKLKLQKESDIAIVNTAGQTIANRENVSHTLDLKELNVAPGMHILKVRQGTKETVQKVILSK